MHVRKRKEFTFFMIGFGSLGNIISVHFRFAVCIKYSYIISSWNENDTSNSVMINIYILRKNRKCRLILQHSTLCIHHVLGAKAYLLASRIFSLDLHFCSLKLAPGSHKLSFSHEVINFVDSVASKDNLGRLKKWDYHVDLQIIVTFNVKKDLFDQVAHPLTPKQIRLAAKFLDNLQRKFINNEEETHNNVFL
uniref:Uncharacterized protein n=1 Tax=Glossina pallidipes TaxID=7398 RepID=A0A1A9ZJA6_GLOPL